MAAKELEDARLIALEEERVNLMRQFLERQPSDAPAPTSQPSSVQ
jgi:hypothetical protein